MTFESFPLSYDLLDGIEAMGFKTPTPVQEQAIPMILEGKDLIACAQTGTGKTGAYLIPLMEQISRTNDHVIKCLVLVPTRELALQIDQQVEGLGYYSNVRSVPVYGGSQGQVWEQQKRAVSAGVDIVIATPGRLMQHLNLGYLNFDNLEFLVLDEADKMLDMGFYDDIIKIVRQLPKNRQTLMFSATMPSKIRDMAQKILNNPEQISLAVSKPAEKIDQRAYLVHDAQKPALLQHILKTEDIQSMIMFASKKSAVDQIERMMQKAGIDARGIHSDKEQGERENILRGFKNKTFKILIATDILSRGIDIENVSHIMNYDVPGEGEDYIHRIGRTARADTNGVAITFINEEQMYRLGKIERLLEKEVPKLPLPEGFGPGPEYVPGTKKQGGDRRGGGKRPGSNQRGNRNKSRAAGAGNNANPNQTDNNAGSQGKTARSGGNRSRSRGGQNRGKSNNTPKTEAPGSAA